jgi:hypothetical protein
MYEQFIRTHDNYKHKSTPSKQHQQRHWSQAKKFILASLISTTILVAIITTLAFTGVISASREVKFPPDFSAALKEFYVATNGESWLRKDNWLDEQKSICEWYGVSCVQEKLYLQDDLEPETVTLIHLRLDSNNLTGTLPAALKRITLLRVLNLRNNSLTGTIPEELEKLEILDKVNLSDNLLTGSVPNVQNWPDLTEIDLSRNQFSGTLPKDFFSGNLLHELRLSHNELEGTIPGPVKTFLTVLDLSSNRLNGTLPFLGLGLVHLNLADNTLEGDTHFPMNDLSSKLSYLNLANNKFSFTFALQPSSLRSITHLDISNNNFTSWSDNYSQFPERMLYCNASNNRFQCPFGASWVEHTCNAICT